MIERKKIEKNEIAAFVYYLESLKKKEDRASLAKLKRGLANPYQAYDMLPVIGHIIPKQCNDWEFKIFMLSGCLYSLHQNHDDKRGNLGVTLRKFKNTLDVGKDSFESRFAALLNSDAEDLHYRLIQIFRQISRDNFSIDYWQLIYDLLLWGHPEKYTQFNWAKQFWGYSPKENNPETEQTG